MLKKNVTKIAENERSFLNLYHVVCEREKYLTKEAKVIQYSAVLRYFMKFLQGNQEQSAKIIHVLYHVCIKLGDIYYKEGLQKQDNSRYFLAVEYYNQALSYSRYIEEKRRVLLALKDVYYCLNDEDALVKVELTWAENHDRKDRFAAYMLLAQNTSKPFIKANFLAKALDEVMAQEGNFFAKYQDTLDVCSQLAVLYELLGEKEKVARVKNLRANALKLLN